MKIVITVSGLAGSGKDTFADYLCQHFNFTKDSLAKDLKDIAKDYFGWDGNKDERGRRLLQLLGTEIGRNRHPFLWLFKFMSKHGLSLPNYGILEHDPLISVMPRDMAEIEDAVKGLFDGKDRAAAVIALRGFLWDGKVNKRGMELIKGIRELAESYSPDFDRLKAFDIGIIDTLKDKDKESFTPGLVIPDIRFKNELEAFAKNGAVSVLIKRPGTVQMQHASEKDLIGAKFDFVIENSGSLPEFYCQVDNVIPDILTNWKAS